MPPQHLAVLNCVCRLLLQSSIKKLQGFLFLRHCLSPHKLPFSLLSAVPEIPTHPCPLSFTISHGPVPSLSHSHLFFHLVNKQKRVVEVRAEENPFYFHLLSNFAAASCLKIQYLFLQKLLCLTFTLFHGKLAEAQNW